MRISVIITSYNQKEYLVDAIESVLVQTIPCHEIIITDDCSSDGSQELIQEYRQKHPELIRPFYHSKNLGIPNNRNFALNQVRGDCVAILDGDDRFLPHKNEREIKALRAHPDSRAVYANIRFFDQNGKIIRCRDSIPQPSGHIFKQVYAGKFGILRSMLIDYSALKEIGFLDPAFWHYDGFDLTVRLSKKYKITYINEPLVEIRVHPEGASSTMLNPSIALSELRGINQKNQCLLHGLPRKDIRHIQRYWAGRLALIEGNIAWKDKNKLRALLKYSVSFFAVPKPILVGLIKVILPSVIFEKARRAIKRPQRREV